MVARFGVGKSGTDRRNRRYTTDSPLYLSDIAVGGNNSSVSKGKKYKDTQEYSGMHLALLFYCLYLLLCLCIGKCLL